MKSNQDQETPSIFNLIFSLLVLGTLISFSLDHSNPNDFKWIGIAMLGALSLFRMATGAFLDDRFRLDNIDLVALAFFVYSILSLLWSPSPLNGLTFIFKMLLCLSIFIHLKNTRDDQLFRGISIAIAASLGIVLLYIPLNIGSIGGFGNRNYITEYCLLAAPFAGGLAFIYRNTAIRWLAVILVVMDGYYLLFHNESKIEFAAVPTILLAAATIMFWKRAKWLVILAWVLVILAVSMLVYFRWDGDYGFRNSLYPRLELNINTTLMWLDAPLFGHGAGSFLWLWPFYQERHFTWLGTAYKTLTSAWTAPEAAHNEYLQFLADFGLIGLSIILYFGLQMLRGIRANKPDSLAWIGLATTGILMVAALLEFPLQNPATLLLAVIGLAFIARRTQRSFLLDYELAHPYGLALITGTFAVIGAIGYITTLFEKAEYHFSQANTYIAANPEYSYRQCVEAYKLYPWNFYYRTDLSVYLNLWSQQSGGRIPVSQEEYDHVFEVGLSAAPSTILLLTRVANLVNSGRYVEKKDEIEKWLAQLRKTASRSPDVWLLLGYYSILTNNDQEVTNAFAQAQRLGLNPDQRKQLGQMQAIYAARISNPNEFRP